MLRKVFIGIDTCLLCYITIVFSVTGRNSGNKGPQISWWLTCEAAPHGRILSGWMTKSNETKRKSQWFVWTVWMMCIWTETLTHRVPQTPQPESVHGCTWHKNASLETLVAVTDVPCQTPIENYLDFHVHASSEVLETSQYERHLYSVVGSVPSLFLSQLLALSSSAPVVLNYLSLHQTLLLFLLLGILG